MATGAEAEDGRRRRAGRARTPGRRALWASTSGRRARASGQRRAAWSAGDTAAAGLAVVALAWALMPGLGPDLLGLAAGWGGPHDPATRDALADLPDTDVAAALRALPVRDAGGTADEAPEYRRESFGQAWADTDRNGCDTRNDILARDLARPAFRAGTHGCVVLSGTLAEPYTGRTLEFHRGEETSAEVQIDHVVALADAWRAGAWEWELGRRQELANDPLNLLAVDGDANQDKEAGRADQWLPPDEAFHCAYVARQVAVKTRWTLSVTTAERDAMARVVRGCPDQALPTS